MLSSLYPPVGFGGAEKAACLLAEALAQAGNDVTVVSFHAGRDEIREQSNGVRIYRVPLANVYWPFGQVKKEHPVVRLLWHLIDIWNWRAAARVGRILDEEKPDVVHTHVIAGFSVAVWREVRKRKIRLVHTLHDYYMLCVRSSMFRDGCVCERQCAGCRLMTGVKKTSSEKLDQVISVSEHVLEKHLQLAYFNRVPRSILYNVMDPVTITPEGSDGVVPGALVFGYIGKVEEAKGIRLLLEATQLLSRSNWRLRIAGTGIGSYLNELKRQFPDSRIEWLGFTPAADFFRSIDVCIVPSIWADPLPYVTVEALFAGKSLIASRSGGIPEIATLGRTVRMFPTGEVSALAECLEEALANMGIWQHGGFIKEESKDLFVARTITAAYSARYKE
jgi:glycosyltransferase involved in cell wall biosynthesis